MVFVQFQNEGQYVPGSYKPAVIDSYINSHFIPYERIDQNVWLFKRRQGENL